MSRSISSTPKRAYWFSNSYVIREISKLPRMISGFIVETNERLMSRVRNLRWNFYVTPYTLHEEENTSSSALKSGATVRPEILVILRSRSCGTRNVPRPTPIPRQDSCVRIWRHRRCTVSATIIGWQEARWKPRRERADTGGLRGHITDAEDVAGMRARARARAHFHNGLGTYYHRTYVRIYIYARARVTNRCIARRMHLAKVTCHSARFGLDGSLSKSNDTLRIHLAEITGHCEAARRDTVPSHIKAILQG